MSIGNTPVTVSFAEAFIGPRTTSQMQTITPLASPTPLTTSFAVGTTDAAALGGLRHFLALTASVTAGLLYTVTEASTMPRISGITLSGTYFVVTVSPALAAVPTSASASVTIPYRCIGATDGGIGINIDPSTVSHFVDQVMDAVLVTYTTRETTITVPSTDISDENIAIALGQSLPTAGSNLVEIGGLLQTPNEFRLLVIGKGQRLARRLWLFHKVINDGSLGLNNAKDTKQMLTNEFKAFASDIDGRNVLAHVLQAA